MINRNNLYHTVAACFALGALSLLSVAAKAQSDEPNDWLNRMSAALQSISYEGTVIRLQDDVHEVLKVVHSASDGVIRERVMVQEGNGLEIIRNGNEVHCILPDQKSVLVEEWNDQNALFSSLPSTDVRFGNEYDLSIVREDRVAGRKAVLLAIRPHDKFRFGHRIWLDSKTAFPLQTQLLSENGKTIEQVKFADISFDKDIPASALVSSYSIENFRWFTQPGRSVTEAVKPTWSNDNLPTGYRLVSTHREELPGSNTPVTHILYSDGLANVSVFVAAKDGRNVAQRSRVGASNSYSVEIGEYKITAVGEVPAIAVEQIATSMRAP